MRRSPRGALAALALLLAACASTGGAPSGSLPTSADPTSAPSDGNGIGHPEGDAAVLVVSSQGGMLIDANLRSTPYFVLLGDGRVIVGGAVPAIFPGPAFMPLNERTLSEDGIQTVLEAVEDTGLFTADLELRGAMAAVTDALDTVFELHVAGHDATVTIYGLGSVTPEVEAPGMSSAELEAHRILSALNDALLTIDTSVPADQWESEGWQPYEPEALRLFVREVAGEPVDPELPPDVREWPINTDPSTLGEEFPLLGAGARCGTVEGEEAAAWLADLATATEISQWTTDGDDRYTVIVRPLLPHEDVACPEPAG